MPLRANHRTRRSTLLDAQVLLARAAGTVSRRSGRGGTSLPGKLLLRTAPNAIAALAARLPRGSAAISATNGKTTTAAMVAAILEHGGLHLVHNRAGANMAGGIAGALLDADPPADLGLFEIDEFWLDQLVPQLHPRALLLANLFRDQLDRFGELETIAERWQVIADTALDTTLVLNADDPLVADLGRAREPGRGVLYFGVEDRSLALPTPAHAADVKHCRRCGAPYVYDLALLGHLGHYRCERCGADRPTPQIVAERIELDGLRGSRLALRTPAGPVEAEIPLPGLYNAYNALGAAALAHALGATPAQIGAGLATVSPAFGRAETVSIAGRELLLLLVKNPAGANEVLRTLALEPGEHRVLAVLNDRIADGRDVSWIWDADYERAASSIGHAVCSGTRAAEMALRLKYAGVPPERLTVVPELDDALDAVLAGDDGGRVIAVPTYTAMLALRELLVERGVAGSSFA